MSTSYVCNLVKSEDVEIAKDVPNETCMKELLREWVFFLKGGGIGNFFYNFFGLQSDTYLKKTTREIIQLGTKNVIWAKKTLQPLLSCGGKNFNNKRPLLNEMHNFSHIISTTYT